MPTLWNPGEPVWDQARGEPYIDPETGDAVVASPGLKVATPDGRTLDGDDVANAVYWRVNIFQGEVARARGEGVPYERVLLQAGTTASIAMTVLLGEALKVRGVASVVGSRLAYYDPSTRAIGFTAALRKKDGSVVPAAVQSGG